QARDGGLVGEVERARLRRRLRLLLGRLNARRRQQVALLRLGVLLLFLFVGLLLGFVFRLLLGFLVGLLLRFLVVLLLLFLRVLLFLLFVGLFLGLVGLLLRLFRLLLGVQRLLGGGLQVRGRLVARLRLQRRVVRLDRVRELLRLHRLVGVLDRLVVSVLLFL